MTDRKSSYVFRPATLWSPFEPTLAPRQLLGRRLVANSQLRFAVMGLFLLGPWIAVPLGIFDRAAAVSLSTLGIMLAVYNTAIYVTARRHREPALSEAAFDALRVTMYVAITLDFLVLAGAVALLGGLRSPFAAFYLLHLVLSCIILSRRDAIAFAMLAFLLVSAQGSLEWLGLAPRPVFGPPRASLDGVTVASIVLVYGALFAATVILLVPLVEWIRRSERELHATNERLDRLSRLRRDFLHVAVHNLRAPVGASRMLVENLLTGLAGPLDDRQHDWVTRIGQRLDGLQEMLQDLDVLGELETDDVDQRAEEVDLTAVARDVVEEYREQGAAAGAAFRVDTLGAVPPVRGIARLLREAVANYVSNAVKYAPRSGDVVVEVSTFTRDAIPWVRVSVRDHGEGIAAEHVPKLFKEFSTPPKPKGAPHQARGSGLGLSIVRRVAEAHGGRVGVDTTPGKGSDFFLEIPTSPPDSTVGYPGQRPTANG